MHNLQLSGIGHLLNTFICFQSQSMTGQSSELCKDLGNKKVTIVYLYKISK